MSLSVIWAIPRTAAAQAGGQVKVTPLGSHAGELCSRDRAILFEDPMGVRILYDPGFTVDDLDSRLGAVDLILLSHSHTDHIGGARAAGGTCAVPGMSAVTNPTLAAIGLTAYLTGDSGLFGDMETIIRRYYNPKLVVMNIGDIFTIGPDEAAFAVSRLLLPTTVMPSHTNEQSTDGGAIVPGSRLDRFVRQLPNSETRVVVPLSGVTVEFDQNGRCVGCR